MTHAILASVATVFFTPSGKNTVATPSLLSATYIDV